MIRAGLVAIAAAAGCTATADPYSVDAVARLAPLPTGGGAAGDASGDAIEGPLEVLHRAVATPTFDFRRTFAAYKVHVPDGAAPWVRLYRTASCTEPGEAPELLADLGVIRRVGDETHFFARDVRIQGRTIDIDLGTAAGAGSLDPGYPYAYLIGKIAVVQAPGPPSDGDGSGGGSDGSGGGSGGDSPAPGGPWLSCGAFEVISGADRL